ncbi:pre-mRNA-splicing factor 38B-like isoform X2 [Liolophura sinensis]|uniref:pre-mRNA-splicing factor 38B-like isoform X2 n=1 Tax=Liolophura sinensis TaxID=3198878 RepID=UPI0031597AF8
MERERYSRDRAHKPRELSETRSSFSPHRVPGNSKAERSHKDSHREKGESDEKRGDSGHDDYHRRTTSRQAESLERRHADYKNEEWRIKRISSHEDSHCSKSENHERRKSHDLASGRRRSESHEDAYEKKGPSHRKKRSRSTSSDTGQSSSSSSSSQSSDDERKRRRQRHKHKKGKKSKGKKHKQKSKGSEPVQLSKFMSERNQSETGRSAVSGKKIKLKLKKSKQDKERDKNRAQILDFLNAAM